MKDLSNMEILPETASLFEERESGISHTPFQREAILFQYIRLGDVSNVQAAIQDYIEHGFVVGRLSKNSLRQMQYYAVSCISLAIHYAILGGLDETDAYNLSDIYIRQVDAFTQTKPIIPYLIQKAVELTNLVADSKIKTDYSPAIRNCLHYIHLHLHNKITIADLATVTHLSGDYISSLFKKEVKINVSAYIRRAKLEATKVLLSSNQNYSTICYNFGFCSETYYINCFKKEFGMTPKEYRRSLNY